jgi:hypothetical protein
MGKVDAAKKLLGEKIIKNAKGQKGKTGLDDLKEGVKKTKEAKTWEEKMRQGVLTAGGAGCEVAGLGKGLSAKTAGQAVGKAPLLAGGQAVGAGLCVAKTVDDADQKAGELLTRHGLGNNGLGGNTGATAQGVRAIDNYRKREMLKESNSTKQYPASNGEVTVNGQQVSGPRSVAPGAELSDADRERAGLPPAERSSEPEGPTSEMPDQEAEPDRSPAQQDLDDLQASMDIVNRAAAAANEKEEEDADAVNESTPDQDQAADEE